MKRALASGADATEALIGLRAVSVVVHITPDEGRLLNVQKEEFTTDAEVRQ